MVNKYQRRHYEDMAELLASIRPSEEACDGPTHYEVLLGQWCYFVENMASRFRLDNQNFDKYKFQAACGCYV